MGVGVRAGLVGFGTATPGRAQASRGAQGRRRGPGRARAGPAGAAYAGAGPAPWPALWTSVGSVGVAVSDHFTTFGASGAITVTTLLGVLLHLVLPPTTHLTGDPS